MRRVVNREVMSHVRCSRHQWWYVLVVDMVTAMYHIMISSIMLTTKHNNQPMIEYIVHYLIYVCNIYYRKIPLSILKLCYSIHCQFIPTALHPTSSLLYNPTVLHYPTISSCLSSPLDCIHLIVESILWHPSVFHGTSSNVRPRWHPTRLSSWLWRQSPYPYGCCPWKYNPSS